MNEDAWKALVTELVEQLSLFVETDGDTSYISTEEKEEQWHIKNARSLIARAESAIAE